MLPTLHTQLVQASFCHVSSFFLLFPSASVQWPLPPPPPPPLRFWQWSSKRLSFLLSCFNVFWKLSRTLSKPSILCSSESSTSRKSRLFRLGKSSSSVVFFDTGIGCDFTEVDPSLAVSLLKRRLWTGTILLILLNWPALLQSANRKKSKIKVSTT